MASHDEDLDALLDGALDEFEEQDVSVTNPAVGAGQQDPQTSAGPSASSVPEFPGAEEDALDQDLEQLLSNMMSAMRGAEGSESGETGDSIPDEDFAKMMREWGSRMEREMQGESNLDGKSLDEFFASLARERGADGDAEGGSNAQTDDFMRAVHEAVRETFPRSAQSGENAEQTGESSESAPDAAVENMMEEIMGVIVNRDVLYPSLKELHSKYEPYFVNHGDDLDPEDESRFRAQQAKIAEIIAVFDSGNEEKSQIMGMLAELQEHGTPPKEIAGDAAANLPTPPPGGLPTPPECAQQ